jgi:hypothetical protein
MPRPPSARAAPPLLAALVCATALTLLAAPAAAAARAAREERLQLRRLRQLVNATNTALPGAASANAAAAAAPTISNANNTSAAALLQSVSDFWLRNGVDQQYGELWAMCPSGVRCCACARGSLRARAACDTHRDTHVTCHAHVLAHTPAAAGGIHGTLDRQGQPIPPTNKTIIQQASNHRADSCVR